MDLEQKRRKEPSGNSRDLGLQGGEACAPGDWQGTSHHQALGPHGALIPPPSPANCSLSSPLGMIQSGVMQGALHGLMDTLEGGSLTGWGDPTGPLWAQERLSLCHLQISPGLVLSYHHTQASQGQPSASSPPRSHGTQDLSAHSAHSLTPPPAMVPSHEG